MSIIGVMVMVAAGIGAVVGMRQAKAGAEWGRPVAAGCAVLVLVLAVVSLLSSGSPAKRVAKSMDRYNYACGEIMGRHLAETFSGSRVLVLLPPRAPATAETSVNSVENSALEGLKSGMGSALELVNAVPIEPPASFVKQLQSMEVDAESMEFEVMNYQMWFNARCLASNLAKHKGTYDVLISSIGLPEDFVDSKLANSSNLPEMAVLNAFPYRIKRLIERGVLDAVVVHKPSPEGGWKDALKVPSDTREAFDKRYVLVTSGNVGDVSATYPSLLN